MHLPCKKNITYYKLQLYDENNMLTPISLRDTSLLTIQPYDIVEFNQINQKVFISVDREIEFEVLAKSFSVYCKLGDSSQ